LPQVGQFSLRFGPNLVTQSGWTLIRIGSGIGSEPLSARQTELIGAELARELRTDLDTTDIIDGLGRSLRLIAPIEFYQIFIRRIVGKFEGWEWSFRRSRTRE